MTDDGNHERQNNHAEPTIEVRNLTKRFGEKLVLNNVSLSLEKGKTTVIIGPSGCGKTILIKHFIVLVRPSEGEVYFKGQRIDHLGERELTRCVCISASCFRKGRYSTA